MWVYISTFFDVYRERFEKLLQVACTILFFKLLKFRQKRNFDEGIAQKSQQI